MRRQNRNRSTTGDMESGGKELLRESGVRSLELVQG